MSTFDSCFSNREVFFSKCGYVENIFVYLSSHASLNQVCSIGSSSTTLLK